MNNTIKLAVASALLAAASSASAAGGIVAGDWTLDIGGIVNMYYTSTKQTGATTDANGGLTAAPGPGGANNKFVNMTTGLLPNYLTVSGKTRQNDLDVGFLISIQPGGSTNSGAAGGAGTGPETRQQYLTFGDASWGSIKLGKDLGIFASDAILSDMTLLGVGSATHRVTSTTTLGRIGTGYIYADWKNQIAYSSPNFNGFSFTAGVSQPWNQVAVNGGLASTGMGGNQPAFEGKASYAFAGDVAGKVWVSGITQRVDTITGAAAGTKARAEAFDIGANVNVAGFGGTAYYFNGKGIGHQAQMFGGLDSAGNERDSDGYYVQGTYTLPGVGTKLGVSYGESKLDMNAVEAALQGDAKSDMLTVGVYHPLTKHLNLVAEYSNVQDTEAAHGATAKLKSEQKVISLGAILFF